MIPYIQSLFAETGLWTALGVTLVAGLMRGFAGFGSAMLMAPIFAILFGSAEMVVTVVAIELVVSLQLFPQVRRHADWKVLTPMSIAACLAMPAGVWLLASVDKNTIVTAVSAVIVAFVLLMWTGWKYTGRRTTLATSAATAAVGTPVTLTLQTFDAGGNPLATGGARVSFASSAPGTFSKVTDNGDGTYAATFTTQRVGSTTFSASVNRVKVGQTATTGFMFASQFPGSAPVAPWSVRAGGFATVYGTAFGTTASNIAIYSGAVAANVTVSALVSNLTVGQFGGVVARYASRFAHYRAGLVVEGGQTYAVIQSVGSKVTTLSRQAVAFPGAGYVGFTVSGSSLTMTLNGITVGQATSRAYTSGTAGISGGTGVGFADFSMG